MIIQKRFIQIKQGIKRKNPKLKSLGLQYGATSLHLI
nr:MAG TPA: hypothetical protein [Caudoviricetes sp.]